MIIGALGGTGRAVLDPRGVLAPVEDQWTLDWWIGADDRWRAPAREPAVRQTFLGGTPVAETRVRVPSGDAVLRTYAIGGRGDVVVSEIENASPAAFIAAFVVRGATSIALEGSSLLLDGRVALLLPFPPARWDVTDLAVEPELCGAQTGIIEPTTFPAGTLQAVLLYPLSHRNRMRIGIVTGDERPHVDLAQVPDADAAVRGWHQHLRTGMRVVGPADATEAIDLARTQVLLDPRPGPAGAAALEDWGFDERAVWAWHGLTLRERRSARDRDRLAEDTGPAGILLRARADILVEVVDGLALLTSPPAPGVDLEVHDAPTRYGTISFAVRWHGRNPALLWELRGAQRKVELSAPTLAPGWSSVERAGEALLRSTSV